MNITHLFFHVIVLFCLSALSKPKFDCEFDIDGEVDFRALSSCLKTQMHIQKREFSDYLNARAEAKGLARLVLYFLN